MSIIDYFSKKKHLKFNERELSAIYKLGITMATADGRVYKDELDVIVHELIRFGVTEKDLLTITGSAKKMEPATSIGIVSMMDSERKKYVAAFLGTILMVDGDIDQREMSFWNLISNLAGLPKMSIGEAILYMQEL